jgi:hypothetical protein
MSGEATEVRECVCGREFTVIVKYARPWTVCPDCMLLDHPLETSACWGDPKPLP